MEGKSASNFLFQGETLKLSPIDLWCSFTFAAALGRCKRRASYYHMQIIEIINICCHKIDSYELSNPTYIS